MNLVVNSPDDHLGGHIQLKEFNMHAVDRDTMTQHLFLIKIKKGECVYIGRGWDVRVGWRRHTERHREKERKNQENRRRSEARLAGSMGYSMSRRDDILKIESLTVCRVCQAIRAVRCSWPVCDLFPIRRNQAEIGILPSHKPAGSESEWGRGMAESGDLSTWAWVWDQAKWALPQEPQITAIQGQCSPFSTSLPCLSQNHYAYKLLHQKAMYK